MRFCTRQLLLRVLPLAVMMACAAIAVRAAPITIAIVPSTTTVPLGSDASLGIAISNVSDLYAFQFDLGFNPTLLSGQTIVEGAFLPAGGSTLFIPGTIDNTGGTIAFTADTLLGPGLGLNGSGILATVTFATIAPGTSSIDLLNVLLLDSNLNDIAFGSANGSVTVNGMAPVPEPSSLTLLATAVLALIALAVARMQISSTIRVGAE
ncbi:MAG: cohesin domain-containing protein [Terriglobia bacterium]